MQVFFILLVSCGLSSCTMQTFVTVVPRSDVPRGAKEFTVTATEDQVLSALRSEQIMFNKIEGGYRTEEILLDEGTKAVYAVHVYEQGIKVVPYWGITDKVRNQIMLVAGYSHSQYASQELQRVIYRPAELRPKMVFDYGVQVFSKAGRCAYK